MYAHVQMLYYFFKAGGSNHQTGLSLGSQTELHSLHN